MPENIMISLPELSLKQSIRIIRTTCEQSRCKVKDTLEIFSALYEIEQLSHKYDNMKKIVDSLTKENNELKKRLKGIESEYNKKIKVLEEENKTFTTIKEKMNVKKGVFVKE